MLSLCSNNDIKEKKIKITGTILNVCVNIQNLKIKFSLNSKMCLYIETPGWNISTVYLKMQQNNSLAFLVSGKVGCALKNIELEL